MILCCANPPGDLPRGLQTMFATGILNWQKHFEKEKARMEKIKVTQVEHHPVCPHCEKKLAAVNWHKVQGISRSQVGYVAIYSCPHCRKVLSTSASGG